MDWLVPEYGSSGNIGGNEESNEVNIPSKQLSKGLVL